MSKSLQTKSIAEAAPEFRSDAAFLTDVPPAVKRKQQCAKIDPRVFAEPLDFSLLLRYNLFVPTEKEVNKLGIRKGTKLTDAPKDFMLRVRLDGKTLAQLDKCCEAAGLSRSEVVRRGIQEQYAKIEK